jgi:hypothetical protein
LASNVLSLPTTTTLHLAVIPKRQADQTALLCRRRGASQRVSTMQAAPPVVEETPASLPPPPAALPLAPAPADAQVPKKKAIRLPFHVSYLPNDAVAKTQRICGMCVPRSFRRAPSTSTSPASELTCHVDPCSTPLQLPDEPLALCLPALPGALLLARLLPEHRAARTVLGAILQGGNNA